MHVPIYTRKTKSIHNTALIQYHWLFSSITTKTIEKMMMMIGLAEGLVAVFCFLCLHQYWRNYKNPQVITVWPIFGMLPSLLSNLSHLHDFIAQVLKSAGGTLEFRGPWFTNMNFILTSNPMNIHHVLSKNFSNYHKGSEFREIFDVFGDGIFSSDSETWKYHRALLHSLFKQKSFEVFLEKTTQKKLERSLLPLLDQVREQRIVVDLQDVFNRFTFDNSCSIVLGSDPNCLSIDFPEVACEKAFNEGEESLLYRHIVPRSVWKLQKWLQIGQEKKMTEACNIFDQFLGECITSKRKELSKCSNNEVEGAEVDLLTALMREGGKTQVDDKFIRDTAFNLFVAGRDTITSALTWFFWLVATHPLVEAKILDEIKENFAAKENKLMVLSVEEMRKLVYLHGALCEALRLFPPIPLDRKQAIKSDTLPSGHHIEPNTMILFSFHAMGRFEEIWGDDCLKFKPERWISERGGIVHVPSYKFISFNEGPRTCLGKDMSFIQMKMVAAAILWFKWWKIILFLQVLKLCL